MTKLPKKIITTILITAHILTIAPAQDSFAFSAQSASYKLTQGAATQGGKSRVSSSSRIWQDAIGEPAAGKAQSLNYIVNAGFISMTISNPPVQTQVIPNKTWARNTSLLNAFDLDDYFATDAGALTYTTSGISNIQITIASETHMASFTQPDGYTGTEKIKFIAVDGESNSTESNEVTLQVEGGSNPPVLSFIPDVTVNEDDLVFIAPSAVDADGGPITYSFTTPLDSTGRWQTNYSSAGTYTVTVTASDSNGFTDAQEVKLIVRNVNRPPQLQPLSDITVNEGDLADVAPVFSDPDNDAVNVYYSAPLDTTGKWLTGYDDSGVYNATVTASDGTDTVTALLKITVNNVNRAPSASLTLSKYTVNPNEAFTITLSVSDPDADAVTYSLKKDGVEISSGVVNSQPITQNLSFSSAGDYTITATVTDSGGLSSSVTKGVDVVDPNADRNSINPVMGDFNGDCLTDLGLHNSDTGVWEICVSDKGAFRNAAEWLNGFGTSRDWQPTGGDFNGDGLTDAGIYNNTTGELKIAFSNGSGFSPSSAGLTFAGASYSWLPVTGNFNGDRYTDFALYNKDTGEVKVALGAGSGFGAFSTWIENFGSDYVPAGGDFNGDGLSDLGLFKKDTGEFKVAFSNTKAFVDGSSRLSGFAQNKDLQTADFNNDGLTDVGYWDNSTFQWRYCASTGSSFTDKGIWLEGFGSSSDEAGSTGDFNGDGITDAAVFDRDNIGIDRWKTRLSTDKPADLLTDISNGIGGTTKVKYTYASTFDNELLPFPVYVANETSVTDTLPSSEPEETYIQKIVYSGGYYDAVEREFRGFAKVKVSDPITNNYSETYFYQGKPGQDGALKAQIEKIISYDGSTSLTTGGSARQISQTINTYEVRKAGPQNNVLGFPALKEVSTTVWEENGSSLETKDSFVYDNIGNLLTTLHDGDVSVPGDERKAEISYASAYETGLNRPLETLLKDKDGNITSRKNFEYDIKGNLAKETVWLLSLRGGEADEAISISYSYDSFGNITSTTNPLGRTTTTEYETALYTYPVTAANSLGHTVGYEYDYKLGVVTKATDPNGLVSENTYDSLGRLIKQSVILTPSEVEGEESQTIATYSYPDFNTKTVTNALGFSSTEYIDGLGRKYKSISQGEDGTLARQITAETFYNNRGQVEKESLAHYADEDPSQISYVRYEYDIRGRIKKTISDFPGTGKDAESSINYISVLYAETTDPQGHRKGTLKDVFGNVTEVTEFTSQGVYKTKYEYDIQNNLVKTIDSAGNTTQIWYDSLGRKLKMSDPDMGIWTYEYDLLGNLIKQTDAKGQVITFEYDALNRLSAKRYPLSANFAVEYYYDDPLKQYSIGRLSKVTDQSGSTEFFYDKLGREIKSLKSVILSPQGEESQSYTVQREYDLLSRLTKLTYPDGEAVNYTYDTNSGLLESVIATPTVPSGEAISYVQDITYNAQGQMKTVKYGNGVTTDYTYGQDLRLSRILTQSPDTNHQTPVLLQDLNYIFDKNGNVTTLTDNLKSNIRAFGYDDLDRLAQANNAPAAGGGYTNYYYQYDSIGNMTYKSDTGVMNYGLNAGPHALTSAGGYTCQYDANGNMTAGKNKTLEYDIENRLTKVTESNAVTSFVYDGDGGRVLRHCEPQSGEAISTTYIGSLYEVEKVAAGFSLRKHIFAGANRIATVSLREGEADEAISYYHTDHLGSSSVITDATGVQAAQYEYTPYGSVSFPQSSSGNPGTYSINHLFTGKELDSTGLYYYGARYYDPGIGRFITADTIIQDPYNPQTFNRYSYCSNNPINYVDPTGHSWFSDVVNKLNKFFDKVVGYLEKITGTPWEVDANAQATVKFGPEPNYSRSSPSSYAPSASQVSAGSSASSSGISTGEAFVSGNVSGFISSSEIGKSSPSDFFWERWPELIFIPEFWDETAKQFHELNTYDNAFNIVVGFSGGMKFIGKGKTVLGSRADTLRYLGKKGYNVLNIKNWTPLKNLKWLDRAIKRGDEFLLATDPLRHQNLMQEIEKASAYTDLELPHLLEKGFIQNRSKMIRP